MSAQETSVATRSTQGTVAPKEALKLRLDLNLEVEIAIQAKVNGDITLSLLENFLTFEFAGEVGRESSLVTFDVLMAARRCKRMYHSYA
ncbi:hypothetical protein EV421DRAFT_1905860 [Armillaria borealis]|uniref:Uncharacterized protein n=3 Tax=Armillaria TaxID=47424 RepID=A0AA39JB80_9AGAR|nr:hypothetical protein EV421DRAFT_1905860 [Armillaria borealis]